MEENYSFERERSSPFTLINHSPPPSCYPDSQKESGHLSRCSIEMERRTFSHEIDGFEIIFDSLKHLFLFILLKIRSKNIR